MISAVFLYNPAAGRFPLSERRRKALLEYLYCNGIRCDVASSHPSREPSTWLNLEHKDLLIVYGGDGTLHQVMSEVVKWKVPVALLPAGTTNVLARELKIPRDPERALSLVVRRNFKRIYLGQGNGEYFHLMAGVGLDGDAISRITHTLKQAMGMGAYYLATAISLMKYPMRSFEVDLEGEIHQGTFAVIGNTRSYGGHLLVTPEASLEENSLDVCLFKGSGRGRYLAYVLGTISGRHIHFPDVLYRRVRHLSITADSSIPVQMDGDLVGHGSIEFSSYGEGIEVAVP
ncbi:MAG: diacylglycerol kinase family protein [Acidobacteriota bacterium]